MIAIPSDKRPKKLKIWRYKHDFPLSRVTNARGCAGKSRFCSFDSNYRAVSVRVSHKFRRLTAASDVGGSLYYVCIMNDQPPAGEKNPKYSLSRVKNAYFSTDYLIFLSLFPLSSPLHASQYTLKIFRPSAGQIPYSRFFPNSGFLFPFFSRPTPHPPPIGTWGILWIRE